MTVKEAKKVVPYTWTTEEDALIREAYASGQQIKDLEAMIEKPVDAIYRRAQKLGISNRNWWTAKEVAYLVKAYRSGASYDTMADHLGRSYSSVHRKLESMGITKREKRPRHYILTDDQEREVVRLYQDEKVSIFKMGRDFGVNKSVLQRVLDKHGVKQRKRHEAAQLAAEKNRRIIPFKDLYNAYFTECLTNNQMKKRFGCGYSTLMNNFEHHGISPMHRHERLKMLEEFDDRASVPKKNRKAVRT